MAEVRRILRRYVKGEGIEEKRVKDLSLSDGILWSVYSSATSSYLVPLTFFILKSKDPAGIIIGVPFLVVPIAQFFAYHHSKVASDLRRTTLIMTLLDRVLWLPLVLLLFIRIPFIDDVVYIILFLSLRTFFASFSGTTWTLWVPFLVPIGERNQYFSIRNFYMKIFSLVGLLIGIGIFSVSLGERLQFTFLILISLLFSTASLLIMRNIPSSNLRNESTMTKDSRNKHFVFLLGSVGLFVLSYSGLLTYFQLYLVDKNYMHVPMTFYSALMILISFSFIISQIYLGKLANIIGNSRSLIIGGVLLLAVPLLLVFSRSIQAAIAESILFGVVQSISSLNIFNEMLLRASDRKVKSVSSFNTVQSLALGSGPVLGNIIIIFSRIDIYSLFAAFFFLSLLSLLLFVIYTLRY
jgi:MFS family permease